MAWPAVALNTLQIINSLLDAYFVQRLPVSNLTALGASTTILFLFVSMSFALGTAATALVSRAFGARDRLGFETASQKCLGLAAVGGVVFALLSLPGTFLASMFLLPAGAQEARSLMFAYLGTFAFGLPAFFIVNTLAGSLRGIGDTKSPMVISGLQIAIHIVLNLFFINKQTPVFGVMLPGLGWGIRGAAAAMGLSAWLAAIGYLVWASRTPLGACWKCSWPGKEWAKRILRIALPAGMMAVVRVTSLMAFTAVLAHVPMADAAIAAMRPAFSIESLAFMPAFGLSVSAAALVGQSLGMKKPDRAARLGWTAAHHAAAVSLAASVFLFVFANQVAHAVVPDQKAVADIVADFLRFVCVTEFLFAYGMVFIGALQGAGETTQPLWSTLVCMWGLRVPLAALFALVFRMGVNGAWLAMSASQAVHGLIAMWLFQKGQWRTKEV